MTKIAKFRWTATIVTDDNKEIVKQFDEMDELHDFVEHGPPWDKLKHIIITYNRKNLKFAD